jgi:hypothetical protein
VIGVNAIVLRTVHKRPVISLSKPQAIAINKVAEVALNMPNALTVIDIAKIK